MPLPKVLLVEDDRRLAELVQRYLGEHGFAVEAVHRGDLAADACRRVSPQLVVLDLMLPGAGGIEVCRQIRAFSDVPILMLTACEDDVEQVLGLESGADDYVLKPIEPRLLLARLRALLRRQQPAGRRRSTASFGSLRIDRAEREVSHAQQRVELSTTEFEILWLLASQPGQILSRDQILLAVRGIGFDGLDRSVDVCIGKLRRKLGDDPREPRRIKTIWGRGYQFNPAGW
ncbi:response regulator transcription factor [Bacillus subtilis subsp. subtilis]|nr:response regulator transcription factor [Bacillus subtilis subsp. subtilis]